MQTQVLHDCRDGSAHWSNYTLEYNEWGSPVAQQGRERTESPMLDSREEVIPMNREHPAPGKAGNSTVAVTNRRGRTSDLERGSSILSHAAKYLMAEPFHGAQTPRAIHHESLAILYEAGRALYKLERRLPSRELMASWLQTIGYIRAGLGS